MMPFVLIEINCFSDMDPEFWLAEGDSKGSIRSSKQWTNAFLITFQYNPGKNLSVLSAPLKGEEDCTKWHLHCFA